jgi:hypothetical protein
VYLVSQHVRSPNTGHEGVNSLLYLHGSDTEVLLATPDDDPGTLTAQSISVCPPGNRVRSYLDIVAPDDVRWDEVRIGLMDFVGTHQRTPLPWEGQSEKCYFRLGMELGLARQWHRELAVLYRSSQALRLANPV